MKFAVISDVHGNINFIKSLPEHKDTILIIPGDIHEVKHYTQYYEIINELCSRYQDVVMVPGNHEYYGSNITKVHRQLNTIDSEIENFHFLQNSSIQFNDVLIVGSTLWTNYDNSNAMTKLLAKDMMNDFRYIRHGSPAYYWERKLTTDDTEFFHFQSTEFIKKEVDSKRNMCDNLKIIIATHHAPSFQSVAPQYIGNYLNGCYCSNLDNYIIDLNPDIWIHGHVHSSFDYNIENTRIICNPYGYSTGYNNENKEFDNSFIFEV